MRKLILALLFVSVFAVSCSDENESIFDEASPTLDSSVDGGGTEGDPEEEAGPGD
ncbi:MAG: hypothetical protein ACFB2Y_16890 [Fulvivirga sp.]